MHQTQFVKARAQTLEEALNAFTEHIKQNGGIDNWWHWLGAFEPQSARITTPPPEAFPRFPFAESDEERSELIAQIKDQALYFNQHFSKEDAWKRLPWHAIFSNLQLAGIPWMKLGNESSDAEKSTRAALRRKSPAKIPEWFLQLLLGELRSEYAALHIPPKTKKQKPEDSPLYLNAACRRDRSLAFERVYEALYSPFSDLKEDLPYLPGLNPYEWPAHLVGKGPSVFYILIDMHK